jgi:predicted ATP-dependent Lon-type protease
MGALLAALSLLAACDAATTDPQTQNDLTTTGFVQVPNINKNGVIDIGLESDVNTQVHRASAGNFGGYAFQTGAVANEGLYAVAGLFPGTSVTPRPAGAAIYSGQYNLMEISNIELNGGFINGDRALRAGNLTLLADFGSNTIVSAPGSALVVNGTANGTNIDGTVSYGGVTGALDGLVGGNQAIGVFHGEGNVGPGTADDYMYAGGFIADRN